MPENVITRWECPYEDCATPFGASCAANLHASGECIAVERTYVATDVLREWDRDQRLFDHTGHPADVAHESLLDDLSTLLDDLIDKRTADYPEVRDAR